MGALFMALKRIVDSIEDIPEALRDAYVERDGKYHLDAEPGDGEKNAEDVRKALQARDAERRKSQERQQRLEELEAKLKGIDLDRLPEALDALSKVDEIEDQKLVDEKRFEELAEKKFQRQIAELNRKIETLTHAAQEQQSKYETLFSDFRNVRVNEAIGKELIAAGIDPDFLDAATMMLSKSWEIDPETRQPVPIEFINNGQDKVTATGADGNALTMKESSLNFIRERPKWALQSHGSGSAHQSSANGNGQYRITEAEAQDFTKYKAAKDRAAKAGAELEIVAN